MRLPNVQIKDTFLARFTKSKPNELRSGILVPVDSSANAFNSLEYALNLAKILNNTIHLFYVIDVSIDELSESTIVAHRVLERKYRKAEACVESLKEMIEQSGVTVVTAESKIGNIGQLIQKQVEYIKPGMIVVGKDCISRNTIDNLINHATCPVIVIPGSTAPRLPSSVILTTEQNTFSEKSLAPLMKIIQRTTRELTVLNFVKLKKTRIEKVAVPHAGTNNVLVNYQQVDNRLSPVSIEDFARANSVNLVCTICQKQPLYKRLFRRSFSTEIAVSVDIPVMVMHEV